MLASARDPGLTPWDLLDAGPHCAPTPSSSSASGAATGSHHHAQLATAVPTGPPSTPPATPHRAVPRAPAQSTAAPCQPGHVAHLLQPPPLQCQQPPPAYQPFVFTPSDPQVHAGSSEFTSSPPPVAPATRFQLVLWLFGMLDKDQDGLLSQTELLWFARRTGFPRTGDWPRAYRLLLYRMAFPDQGGITLHQFERLMDLFHIDVLELRHLILDQQIAHNDFGMGYLCRWGSPTSEGPTLSPQPRWLPGADPTYKAAPYPGTNVPSNQVFPPWHLPPAGLDAAPVIQALEGNSGTPGSATIAQNMAMEHHHAAGHQVEADSAAAGRAFCRPCWSPVVRRSNYLPTNATPAATSGSITTTQPKGPGPRLDALEQAQGQAAILESSLGDGASSSPVPGCPDAAAGRRQPSRQCARAPQGSPSLRLPAPLASALLAALSLSPGGQGQRGAMSRATESRVTMVSILASAMLSLTLQALLLAPTTITTMLQAPTRRQSPSPHPVAFPPCQNHAVHRSLQMRYKPGNAPTN